MLKQQRQILPATQKAYVKQKIQKIFYLHSQRQSGLRILGHITRKDIFDDLTRKENIKDNRNDGNKQVTFETFLLMNGRTVSKKMRKLINHFLKVGVIQNSKFRIISSNPVEN